MDAAEFKRWFKGSPIERTRRTRLLRNVAIAMGNSGETRFLAQLETWAVEPDPGLSDAASWAAKKIRDHPNGMTTSPEKLEDKQPT
jgi:epoxyqueuosine reductase